VWVVSPVDGNLGLGQPLTVSYVTRFHILKLSYNRDDDVTEGTPFSGQERVIETFDGLIRPGYVDWVYYVMTVGR